MSNYTIGVLAALFLINNLKADSLQDQLRQAYELECKQRAYDLMIELEVPYHEAYEILVNKSTLPPGCKKQAYSTCPHKLQQREQLLADQPDEEPGFPQDVTNQALMLVAQYKKLYCRYLVITRKEKIVTTDYVERLIADFKQLKKDIMLDAGVRRAVTVRIVPFLIRILKGKDVISYIDEWLTNLEKVLRS